MGQPATTRIMSLLVVLQSLHLVFIVVFDVFPFYWFAFTKGGWRSLKSEQKRTGEWGGVLAFAYVRFF